MYRAVEPQPGEGNIKAPDGQIWVCGACGKKSIWKYGFGKDGAHKNYADHGGDESCMLNSILCYVD